MCVFLWWISRHPSTSCRSVEATVGALVCAGRFSTSVYDFRSGASYPVLSLGWGLLLFVTCPYGPPFVYVSLVGSSFCSRIIAGANYPPCWICFSLNCKWEPASEDSHFGFFGNSVNLPWFLAGNTSEFLKRRVCLSVSSIYEITQRSA